MFDTLAGLASMKTGETVASLGNGLVISTTRVLKLAEEKRTKRETRERLVVVASSACNVGASGTQSVSTYADLARGEPERSPQKSSGQ
eukprot:scaffold15765_cov73-Cylindrotheca_fusiformis.AAC.1